MAGPRVVGAAGVVGAIRVLLVAAAAAAAAAITMVQALWYGTRTSSAKKGRQ